MRILIADDSEFMRVMLKNIVHTAFPDSTIDEATTGQEAIDSYAQNHHDVLLLDVMMPDKTGLDALREIGPAAPAIIISAADQEDIVSQATALGARSFIPKPFDQQHVVQTIKEVMGPAQA